MTITTRGLASVTRTGYAVPVVRAAVRILREMPVEQRLASPESARRFAPRGPWPLVAAFVVFLLAVACAHAVTPLRGVAPIAYDTAAITLYFDRIVSGELLEAFVPTTPKPLLSVLYGTIWQLTHDWRPMVWLAVGAGATAASLATLLGWRVAGPAAGWFAGVGLAVAPLMVWESLQALATPWAVLGWVAAGLAVTRDRPRYGIAGVALLVATLARVETLAIVGAAVATLILLRWGPGGIRRPTPRAAWLVPVLPLLAIPILLGHDWLLVRDPLYWAGVSGRYSATKARRPAGSRAWDASRRSCSRPLGGIAGICVLAVVGIAAMWRAMARALAIGVMALAGGVTGFMLIIGYQGYVVPDRYASPIVVSAILAGGIGLGATVTWVAARLGRHPEGGVAAGRMGARAVPIIAGVIGIGAVVILSWPIAPFDRSLLRAADRRVDVYRDTDRVEPVLAEAVLPGSDGAPAPLLLVPSQVYLRSALELDIDLTRIAPGNADVMDVAAGDPPPERTILYLSALDPRELSGELAVAAPTMVGSTLVVPIVADPRRGTWVVRLESSAS